jgi:hypothetical protein
MTQPNYSKLSTEELLAEKAKLDYRPSTGDISNKAREFLLGFLKPEDIPQKLDGQLDAHLSTAAIIGVLGGNQSGKTTWRAIEDFIAITGEVPDSMKDIYPKEKLPTEWPVPIRVVGVSDSQVEAVVKFWYRHWCPRKHLKDGNWKKSFDAKYNILHLYEDKTGKKELGTIQFMNNKQDVDVFQGVVLKKVGYDEEPDEAIRNENKLRFATTKLREDYAFTPTNGMSWSHDLFDEDVDDKGRKIDVFRLCSVTNPKANLDSLRDILIDETDYNVIKMRLLGEYVSLSGLIYGRLFNESIHVIPAETLYTNGKIDYNDFLVYRGGDVHQVTEAHFVEVAIDSFGFRYVVGCCKIEGDTEDMKRILAQRARERGYRLGQTAIDRSMDTTIKALGGINIFKLLQRGANSIPAMTASEKYTGSIAAGIDQIKKDFKIDDITEKPKLFILDLPENRPLIKAFKTLERDKAPNEGKMGPRDKILEGRQHYHAAIRYVYQMMLNWFPTQTQIYEQPPEECYV